VSVWVHALPSLHVAPFALAGFEQVPFAGLHVPGSWHWSCATQVTLLPPTQTPAWQLSVWVHALPSLQDTPLAFGGFEQTPVAALQTPTSWHWSSATHWTGVPGRQTPLELQVSAPLQLFPSLQEVPAATLPWLQEPSALHVSVVHGLLSLQDAAVQLRKPS
jgi:hypothetical protein